MSGCLPLGIEDSTGFPAICLPGAVCSGSVAQQCTCSAIMFFLNAGCNACFQPSVQSWDNYSQTLECDGDVPQQFPPPLPTGATTVPSWVLEMAFATPIPSTFDLEAASALVATSGISATISASSTSSTLSTLSPRTASYSTGAAPNSALIMATSNISIPPATDTSTNQHTVSAPVIIGIIVAVCAIGSVPIFLWRRRRRRRYAQHLRPNPLPVPSALMPRSDSPTVRRWNSENTTHAARGKITGMARQAPLGCASQGGTAKKFIQLLYPRGSAEGLRSPDHDMALQVEELRRDVRELKVQLRSPSAHDAPPGYTEYRV
ncbi:hypothetical protein MSAN_00868600 [Mycena sanguinolenta]|uniref:Uncharacterized protein n=1 Tax=Mycena sanguinolenta TaxID=230812 RepID=A0A8H6YVU1_9AGAR|nr:hypothetical protein MSAN_00868600 [Mycena sanguinolenta]